LKIWTAALAGGFLALGAAAGAPQAQAQAAPFLDTPTNHWAYESVQDLAKKGIVIGYPDGTYGGKRPMTRYEFAVALDRALRTIADMVAAQQPGAPPAPAGTPAVGTVTQDDLNKLQALIDKFRPELDTIEADLKTAQDNIDALRADVLDAKALANKAQATADNSYGVGSARKFQISGYIQARYQDVPSGQGSQQRFQQGTVSSAGAYNGNYAQTGNQDSFEVRRARLKFTGQVTPNSKYGIQIDTDGAVNNSATPQVTVREAFGAYTFGNGDAAKNLTLTAGQFATPFGYALPISMANSITPERPLAFSESGSAGIFQNQDYDKGVQLGYNLGQKLLFIPAGLKVTAAFINGAGRFSENTDRTVDQVYHIGYQTPNKVFALGGSYYEGQIKTSAIPAGLGTGYQYTGRKKELYGADAQLALPVGLFVNAEYVGGLYEQKSFFSGGTAPFTNDSTLTTVYAKDNKIDGYYAVGGWKFGQTGAHPLTLAAQYDVLKRGEGPGGSDAYTDKNLGYGALYNLDKATRLRVWYTKPDAVAHNPAAAAPPKYGILTGEVQVKF
jgi:hypothetical protein